MVPWRQASDSLNEVSSPVVPVTCAHCLRSPPFVPRGMVCVQVREEVEAQPGLRGPEVGRKGCAGDALHGMGRRGRGPMEFEQRAKTSKLERV